METTAMLSKHHYPIVAASRCMWTEHWKRTGVTMKPDFSLNSLHFNFKK